MMWLTVDEGSAVYVVPDNYLHDLDPDGLCRRCEPTVEAADDQNRALVIHHEDA